MEKVADGVRIAQVSDVVFEVAEPLYWVDCPDDVLSDHFYMTPSGTFEPVPPPENPELNVSPIIPVTQA